MSSKNSAILTAFNDHFIEFVDDIISLFPDNNDILTAKKSFGLIRKANPRLIIKIWKNYVVNKYANEIESGDIHFFINKDYGDDLQNHANIVTKNSTDSTDKILEAINRLREPIKLMSVEDQAKTMKYIQNLTKLSGLFIE